MAASSTSYHRGKSGNPKGRPRKGYSITETFRDMFCSDPELKAKLARNILDKAIAGDISACKLIWSYVDGLPSANSETSDLPFPIPILSRITDKI